MGFIKLIVTVIALAYLIQLLQSCFHLWSRIGARIQSSKIEKS